MAFSLGFQKVYLITKTIPSHNRPEQFWKQNTIVSAKDKETMSSSQ
jgi:hypothetical protein